MRIGTGYDVHRFIDDRDLIIGGVKIPYEKGLDGHSDADVLTHAIMDALLGAAGLGDIGKHFPDKDPSFKDVSSIKLLENVKQLLDDKAYIIENIDTTIIAQEPKLATYIPDMVRCIADALVIEEDRVNIKATTEEGLGFTGAKLGIAANAVCLLETMFSYQYDATPQEKSRGCEGCGGCSRYK